MPFDFLFASKNARFWFNLLIQASVIGVVVILLAFIVGAVLRATGGQPPVNMTSLEPRDLGPLCPGDLVIINNHVEILAPTVLVYYISVLDETETYNIPGTQVVLSGYQHPKAASFEQHIPWVVPELPPGEWVRAFAARGTDGEEKAVHVLTMFEIPKGDVCDE